MAAWPTRGRIFTMREVCWFLLVLCMVQQQVGKFLFAIKKNTLLCTGLVPQGTESTIPSTIPAISPWASSPIQCWLSLRGLHSSEGFEWGTRGGYVLCHISLHLGPDCRLVRCWFSSVCSWVSICKAGIIRKPHALCTVDLATAVSCGTLWHRASWDMEYTP